MKKGFYLGIDVGTGSARAGIFDEKGKLHGYGSRPIQTWRPAEGFVEQSSEDIWEACCFSSRAALKQASIPPSSIRGVGFDATCSLVVLDRKDRPITVSPTGRPRQNVIVWMDHRAIEETGFINSTRHPVLKNVGGVMSPEMQSPKLLWIQRYLKKTWRFAGHFFDLPDFLTYRATGDDTRSLCSVTCKWTYQSHWQSRGRSGWDRSYWERIGLKDLASEHFRRIGSRVSEIGTPVGQGLSHRAARELGLMERTPVATSCIDAHAGGIGLLGTSFTDEKLTLNKMQQRLALIAGTSSCHMAVSSRPIYIKGVWGPYFSAMIPGMWLSEGGQSSTGSLIDHLIQNHAAVGELQSAGKRQNRSIYDVLNDRLDDLSAKRHIPASLTSDLHLLPYFHGNRSPRANPTLRGVISGLSLSSTLDDLALQYLSAVQAIAYGTRHIIEAMNAKGHRIQDILVCGGWSKNRIFLREHADITGCNLVLPKEPEAVLLGSAILGATASGDVPHILSAMKSMSRVGSLIAPTKGRTRRYHQKKYLIFHEMYEDLLKYRRRMSLDD